MKKTKHFAVTFICGGIMAAIVSLMGHFAFGQPLIDDRARIGDKGEFYAQSSYGTHCHLVLKDDILPVLASNLSEKEKTHLRDAISSLNTMNSSLKYKLYDQKVDNVKDYVVVKSVEEIYDFAPGVIGQANYNYQVVTAEIKFPITITVESKYADRTGTDENGNTGSIMQNIFEHELLHTCGLIDLTDEKYRDKSIMYYSINGQPISWSPLDEENVAQVYKPAPAFESKVVKPRYIDIFYTDDKHKYVTQKFNYEIEDETEVFEEKLHM